MSNVSFKIDVSGFIPFSPLSEALNGVAFSAAEMTIEEIGKLMDEPKSGRMYGSHQASAAGEAPAKDTGALWESYLPMAVNDTEAHVFSSLMLSGYGEILEDHRDRPSSEPAVERAMPKIEELIHDRIDTAWLI